jgi:polyhydroxyalkanoate synthase subunit PhaE
MSSDFFESMKGGAEQYWKSFSDLASGTYSNPNATSSWSESLEQMSKLYGKSDQNEALLDQMMGQGKAFLSMLENVYKSGQGGAGSIDFAALAKKTLEDLGQQNPFTAGFGSNPFAQSGANPFAFMQNANMPAFDFSKFTQPGGFSAAMPQLMDFPSFGLNRESQERKVEMFKGMKAHFEANKIYNALTLKSMQNGIERMQSKLAERSELGRELDSMKAVYDLWIDSLEESFAQTALSPEFQDAYADLVNTKMRVQASIQKQVALTTGELGMPTRGELDSVHKKLADMRRDARSGSGGRHELEAIKQELAALKREVALLKKPSASKGLLAAARESVQSAPKNIAKAKPVQKPASKAIKAAVKATARSVKAVSKSSMKSA